MHPTNKTGVRAWAKTRGAALLAILLLGACYAIAQQTLSKEYIYVNGKLVAIEKPSVSPPGVATLISPTGTIGTNTPTYTWNAVSNSTWYYLWVHDSEATPKIQIWYTAAQAGCPSGTGTCSVTPSIASFGSCQWWIQTWNAGGFGPWSSGMTFSTPLPPPPGPATLISPTGTINTDTPTYTWNAVSSSTWYYLWVHDSEATPKIQIWYTAVQAGCPSGTGTCSVTPSIALAAGSCQWWIQTWNVGGLGPWSSGMLFTYVPVPGAAALNSPSGTMRTATSAYNGNAVDSSTWHYLRGNNSTLSPRIQTRKATSATGCSLRTGTCPPTPGIEWASGSCPGCIRRRDGGGYAPRSDPMSLWVSASQ